MADSVLNTDAFNAGIDRLLQALDKLDKRVDENVKQAKSFDNMFKTDVVDRLIASIKTIDKVSADSFKLIADGIANIANSLQKLNSVENSGDGSGIISIIKLIENISRISSSVSSDQLSKTLDRLSISLVRFNDLINHAEKGIKPGTVRKLAQVYGSLALVFKLLSGALSYVPGGNEADQLSRVFDRVGRGLRAIGTIKKIADIKTLFNLAKVITALAISLRIASKIAGDSERLKGFGVALSGIANFFKQFSGASGEQAKSLKGFRQNVKIIRQSLSDLNKIKVNPQKAEAIARQIEALSKIQSSGSSGGGSGNSFIKQFFAELGGNLVSDAIGTALEGIRKLSGAIASLGKDGARYIQQLGRDISEVGRQSLEFSRNILQNFGIGNLLESSAVASAKGFEQISSQLVTFGNLTASQLKSVQDFSNQIGIDYPLSANEALDATLNLVKAGRSLEQVRFILPGAADLATLSDSKSIDAATKFLIASANGYERFSKTVIGSFENIGTASDIVFAAANKSTASIDNLYEGLVRAAPAANSFGLTMQETAAFLTQFEDAEIRGTEAGTLLRTVLNEISKTKAQDEFRKLGIATQTADGRVRSLNDVIKDLSGRYEELGYTQVQINQSVAQFGDTFAQQGVKILLARGGIDEVVAAMGQVQPAVDAAQQSMNNLTGQLEQLSGSFETLLTKVALPLISRFFTPLVKVARSVIDFFLELPDPILETVGNMIFLGSALATVVAGFFAISGVLLIVSGAFTSLVGIIGRVVFSAPLIIGAIGSIATSLTVLAPLIIAVVGGFTALSAIVTHVFRSVEGNVDGAGDSFSKFRDKISEIFIEVSGVFSEAGKIISRFFGTVKNSTSSASGSKVSKFFDNLSSKAEVLKNAISQARQGLEAFNFFLSGTGTVSAFARYESLLENLSKTDLAKVIFGDGVTAARIDKFFRDTMSVLTRVSNAAKDIGAGLVANLFGVGDPSRLLSGIKSALSLVTETIQGFTGLNLEDVLFDINQGDFLPAAGNFANALLNSLKNAVVANKDKFVDIMSFVLNFALNPFALLEFISQALGADQLANVFGYLGDTLTGFIKSTIGTIIDTLGGQSIGEAILGNFGSGAQGIAAFFEVIQNVVSTVTGVFVDKFLPVLLRIPVAVQNLWNTVQPIFQQFSNFISGPFSEAILNTIESSIMPAFKTLTEFLVSAWNIVSPGLIQFANYFINDFAPTVVDIITNQLIPVIDLYIQHFINVFNKARPPLEEFARFFVEDIVPAIINIVQNSLVPLFEDIFTAIAFLVIALSPLIADFVGFIASKILPIVGIFIKNFLAGIDLLITGLRAIIRIATPIIIGLAKLFEVTLYPVIKTVIDIAAFFFRLWLNGTRDVAKAVTTIIKFFLNVSDTIFNALQPAFLLGVKLVQLFGKVIELVVAVVRVPLRFLFDLVKNVFQRIGEFFSQGSDEADAVGNVISAIYDRVKVPLELFGQIVEEVFKRVIQFIDDLIQHVDWVIDQIESLENLVGGGSTSYEVKLSLNTDEAIQQIQTLSDDFKSEDIAIAGKASFFFNEGFNRAMEEGGEFARAYINELNELAAAGKITAEDARGLTEAINSTNQASIQAAEQSQVTTEALYEQAQAIIDQKDSILEQVKAQKDAIRDQQIIGNDIIPELEPYEITVDDTEVEDFRSDLIDLNEDLSEGGELAVDMEALQEAKKDYQDELKDIQRDTVKAERNREKQVRSAEEKIQEIRDDFERDKIEDQDKFNLETERNLEDHQRKMRDLDRKTNDDILDAAIARDAGAARSAVNRAKQEKESANEELKISEDRRLEDFELEKQKAQAERDLKLQEAQKDLDQIRSEHAIEREEERIQNEERLAEKKAALDELLAMEVSESEQRHEIQRLSNERQRELMQEWIMDNELAAKAIQIKWIEATKLIAGLDPRQAAFQALGTGLNMLSQGNLSQTIGNFAGGFANLLSGQQPIIQTPSMQNAPVLIPNQQGSMGVPGSYNSTTNSSQSNTIFDLSVNVDMSNMQNGSNIDAGELAANVEAQVVKGVTKVIKQAQHNRKVGPL